MDDKFFPSVASATEMTVAARASEAGLQLAQIRHVCEVNALELSDAISVEEFVKALANTMKARI